MIYSKTSEVTGKFKTMDIVILYDPKCATSRKAREFLEDEGLQPILVEFQKQPLSTDQLRIILKLLKMGPRALMRTKEPIYRQLGLNDPMLSEGQLIQAMAAHPALIERPIVLTEDDAVLARPADKVFNLL